MQTESTKLPENNRRPPNLVEISESGKPQPQPQPYSHTLTFTSLCTHEHVYMYARRQHRDIAQTYLAYMCARTTEVATLFRCNLSTPGSTGSFITSVRRKSCIRRHPKSTIKQTNVYRMTPNVGDIDIEGRQYMSRNEKAVGEIKVTSNNNSNILIKGGYLGRKQAT